jgi:putative hydrolase of the HAD superfamily
VTVLLCDLDDTLFDHDRATRDALGHLRQHHGVLTEWTLEELDARHRDLLETLHVDVLAGRLTIDEARRARFGRLLAQADTGDPALAASVAAAYREAYAAQWHTVPGAIDLLQAVRQAGHAIVIVTNNGVAEQRLKLSRCGLAPWIDDMVTSEEAGVSKPARGIFDQALARTGASPSEAVMLGDAWLADVEGARAAGIAAVWFNRAGRPRPDPAVPELSSLLPVEAAMAVLGRAGLTGDRRASARYRPGPVSSPRPAGT